MAVIDEVAAAFAEVRAEFFAGVTCKLLKEDSETRQFNEVGTITDWFFEYSEFRESFKLEIAQNSVELTAWVNDASHIQVGADVYTISQSDTLPPKGTSFTWKLFCTRDFKRSQIQSVV